MIRLPEKAALLISQLESHGHEAFIVGGCVRDALLGRAPNDWDICTSASPEEMKRCFSNFRVIETGLKHGTLTVLAEGEPFEITTYRIDGEYSDSRHPDQVVVIKRNIQPFCKAVPYFVPAAPKLSANGNNRVVCHIINSLSLTL